MCMLEKKIYLYRRWCFFCVFLLLIITPPSIMRMIPETIELSVPEMPALPTVQVPKEAGIFCFDNSTSNAGETLLPLPQTQYCVQNGETAETFFGCYNTEGLLFRLLFAVTKGSSPITRCMVYVTPSDNASLFRFQFFEDGYTRPTPYPISPHMFRHFPELQAEMDKGLICVSE